MRGAARRLAFAAAIALSAELSMAQGRITLLTEEWAPYNYTEDGVLTGFSTQIVKRILTKLSIDAQILSMPGTRAKHLLDTSHRTAYFSMFRTPERESQYKWVGPLAHDVFYFYKRRGDPIDPRTLDDARRAPLIACRDAGLVYSYLKGAGFKNLDPTPASGGIYEKLLAGRCSLAIGEPPLGVGHILKSLGVPADALERTALGILENDLYIAFSKDVPDSEIGAWQGALDTLKASSFYDDLVREYMR